jgi:hypothetical protein
MSIPAPNFLPPRPSHLADEGKAPPPCFFVASSTPPLRRLVKPTVRTPVGSSYFSLCYYEFSCCVAPSGELRPCPCMQVHRGSKRRPIHRLVNLVHSFFLSRIIHYSVNSKKLAPKPSALLNLQASPQFQI